jgi:ribonucleoside-diphosphate reductase alpha chain
MGTINYSRQEIRVYDKERHVSVEEANELLGKNDLSPELLKTAMETGLIRIYKFNGGKYLDRLDIGRVYEKPVTEKKGLSIERFFTRQGESPLETEKYSQKHLEIKTKDGKVIFEIDAEFPESWDENSARIVAQKYFFRPVESEWQERIKNKTGFPGENSLKHLISRVTNFFADEGEKRGYFATPEDKSAFRDELLWLQLHRRGAFNSPVQFNAGIFNEYGIRGSHSINFYRNPETGEVIKMENQEFMHPQAHACFITGPRDDLESILQHTVNEGAIFSAGSGVGQDIGALREEGAPLSGGGKSSGPLSFLKTMDDNAGTIKSGGKSRRAARMTTMRYYHPDIMKFIEAKLKEDKKALTLIRNGYEGGMDGEAYRTVTLQNTNVSVRLDDYFFEQLEKGGDVELKRIKTGEVVERVSADRMLKEIAFGSWRIGDPGVQYESKIQEMHTVPNSGRQNSTNPCGEYMFLNDTSCNLASLNLLSFSDDKGNFDYKSMIRAARIFAIAQDIANDAASYPVEQIAEISPEFRTIGLGFANLGSLLMRRGLAYNSDEGRALAGGIMSLITGVAYETSAEMAGGLGTFTHFNFNRTEMLGVMDTHKRSLDDILWDKIPEQGFKETAYQTWRNVILNGIKNGFRNAQTTVIAPTGTISYLMGAQDSTGIEPPISLIINKDLAGGGSIRIANAEVPNALKNLGYDEKQIKDIIAYVEKQVSPELSRGTVIGAPHLSPDHYSIFDTALGNYEGKGSISFEGHVRMMGAVQPFVSGGISKTNNLPERATVKDHYEGFILGHKLGLKGLTTFRTNSKPISAMNFGRKNSVEFKRGEKEDLVYKRNAFEQEVEIGGSPFHIIVSEYPDGRPGQILFAAYKEGGSLKSLFTIEGITASKALKRGVSLEDVVKGWLGQGFEPHGFVKISNSEGKIEPHPYIKEASSALDFASKLLLLEYMGRTEFAGEPDKVNRKQLRGFQNGAFRTFSRMNLDSWDVNAVLNDAELGGFVAPTEEELINGNNHTILINERGVTCDHCGNIMRKTSSNCYECPVCAEKRGGCGL